jgi:hypothetical protein
MPHFTFPITKDGYTLDVQIGLKATSVRSLMATGQPIPPPVQARALLDTASDKTAVAVHLLRQLGIAPRGPVRTQTAGGIVKVQLYEVSLSIPNPTGARTPMLVHPEWEVTEFLHAPPQIDVLIGLDVLNQCLVVIDGPGGRFTLGF